MIKLVYKILPVYIRYVPDSEWKYGSHAGWYSGWFFCVRIHIQESHRDDSGLLEHELTHARQIYTCPLLYWILYRFAWFRYRFELRAYINQINTEALAFKRLELWELFTGYICDWYGLNVNKEKVILDLLRGIR